MTRYIDAELAIKDIQETYCKPCKKRGDDYHGVMCRACWVGDCICIIDDCEEADVKPVVHAHWISLEPEIGLYGCSKCEYKIIKAKCNYCPNCGSRMDDEHD